MSLQELSWQHATRVSRWSLPSLGLTECSGAGRIPSAGSVSSSGEGACCSQPLCASVASSIKLEAARVVDSVVERL